MAEQIVRIDDPELDVDMIVAEVRGRVMAEAEPGAVTELGPRRGDDELAWHLFHAAEANRATTIAEQIRPAPGPLGALATRLRRPFHQLARFYVQGLARRQAVVDGHLIGAVRVQARRAERAEAEVAALRAEVARLRAELDARPKRS